MAKTTKKKTTRKKKTPRNTTQKGRPAGSKNKDVDIVDGQVTRCTKCGSTERAKYMSRRELAYGGIDPQTGEHYTHTVWRRTKCLNCNQHRTDRHRENRKVKKSRK